MMNTNSPIKPKVSRHIERLRHKPYQKIETEVARKRIAWCQQHYSDQDFPRPLSPRRAYELFCFDYLGLEKDDVPVVSEHDASIVWLSLNACPTFDACQTLGLDVRTVCRAIYEKSTQAFFSYFDPQLRFYRDYREMRPNTPHCREMIVRIDFEQMMGVALEEAYRSKEEGNKGYGAVVAFGNQILSRAHDTTVTEGDPSLHAEVNAIRQAVNTLGDPNLCGAILFSTCEPCPMCSALAVWANVTTIVYGISIEDTVKLGRTRIQISAREIIAKSLAIIDVIGDVRHDECQALYG